MKYTFLYHYLIALPYLYNKLSTFSSLDASDNRPPINLERIVSRYHNRLLSDLPASVAPLEIIHWRFLSTTFRRSSKKSLPKIFRFTYNHYHIFYFLSNLVWYTLPLYFNNEVSNRLSDVPSPNMAVITTRRRGQINTTNLQLVVTSPRLSPVIDYQQPLWLPGDLAIQFRLCCFSPLYRSSKACSVLCLSYLFIFGLQFDRLFYLFWRKGDARPLSRRSSNPK